ncbi:helix-turn-helix transcriptional regulator [Streptococcus suis]|nr:helix-turn-helix transcriptional regulator [Streptococcus suis]NQH95821.1 helix-turn-helix transcriptional regulator [Streptococcus suis]
MIKRHSFNKYAPKPEAEPYAEGTLKDLRLKLRLTQKELSAIIGYSVTSISIWENSNSAPTEVIHKLQKLYEDAKNQIKGDGIDIIEKLKLKYVAGINHTYYELKDRHKPKSQKRRPTFCQLDPLNKTSWKAEIENPVIVWK